MHFHLSSSPLFRPDPPSHVPLKNFLAWIVDNPGELLACIGNALERYLNGQRVNFYIGREAANALYPADNVDSSRWRPNVIHKVQIFVWKNDINEPGPRNCKDTCFVGNKHREYSRKLLPAILPNNSVELEVIILMSRDDSKVASLDPEDIVNHYYDVNADQVAVKVVAQNGSWQIADYDPWTATDDFRFYVSTTQQLNIPKLSGGHGPEASPDAIVRMAQLAFERNLRMNLPADYLVTQIMTQGMVNKFTIEIWNSFNESFKNKYPHLFSMYYLQLHHDRDDDPEITTMNKKKWKFFHDDSSSSSSSSSSSAEEDRMKSDDEDYSDMHLSSSSDESFKADSSEDYHDL